MFKKSEESDWVKPTQQPKRTKANEESENALKYKYLCQAH